MLEMQASKLGVSIKLVVRDSHGTRRPEETEWSFRARYTDGWAQDSLKVAHVSNAKA